MRNENYWEEGKPYLDEVHIIDFADGTRSSTRCSPTRSTASATSRSPQVSTVESNGGFEMLDSQAGGWLTITMAVDQEPFNDVRVRQAMRLIVDREEMVERVLAGYGRVANDLYAPLDACYRRRPAAA